MLIPNGLTLEIVSRRADGTFQIGNTILSPNERAHVHFETTKKLEKALKMAEKGDVDILDDIPQSVLDLLDRDDTVNPNPTAPSKVAKGLFYRDEFELFRKEIMEKNNLTMSPSDKSVTYEKLDPEVYGMANSDLGMTYTGEQLTKVTESEGADVKRDTTITYNPDGTVNTVTEDFNGHRVVKTLQYEDGDFVSLQVRTDYDGI